MANPRRNGRDISLENGIRNGTYFIHGKDGHSYHFNREMKGGRLSLECMHYRKNCRGRASVNPQGQQFRQTQRHNHSPNWNLLHERRLRAAVLQRCRSGATESLRTIYDEERRKLRYRHQSCCEEVIYTLLKIL